MKISIGPSGLRSVKEAEGNLEEFKELGYLGTVKWISLTRFI